MTLVGNTGSGATASSRGRSSPGTRVALAYPADCAYAVCEWLLWTRGGSVEQDPQQAARRVESFDLPRRSILPAHASGSARSAITARAKDKGRQLRDVV